MVFSVGSKVAFDLGSESKLTGHLNLGYDRKADQGQATASLVGGGGSYVAINGVDPSSTLIRAGVGYDMARKAGTSVSVNYDLEAKSSDFTNHMLSVKMKMPF